MISLNYRDSRPIYEQIRDGLRKLIVTGAMQRDEKLPSVRSLAQQLSINPNTIQRAYAELESEGYIYSVPGKGSFASGDTGAEERRRRRLDRAEHIFSPKAKMQTNLLKSTIKADTAFLGRCLSF